MLDQQQQQHRVKRYKRFMFINDTVMGPFIDPNYLRLLSMVYSCSPSLLVTPLFFPPPLSYFFIHLFTSVLGFSLYRLIQCCADGADAIRGILYPLWQLGSRGCKSSLLPPPSSLLPPPLPPPSPSLPPPSLLPPSSLLPPPSSLFVLLPSAFCLPSNEA